MKSRNITAAMDELTRLIKKRIGAIFIRSIYSSRQRMLFLKEEPCSPSPTADTGTPGHVRRAKADTKIIKGNYAMKTAQP